MLKTKISDDERCALQQYNRTTRLELIRLKCFSVLIADQGLSGTAVSEVVGKSIRTVNRWLKDWNKHHIASIFSDHTENHNAAKPTADQLQQIKEVLSQPPSEYGIPKEMWDVPTLKDYVSATFSITYESPESYYFILRFSDLSFKYPDTFDLRRNEQFIAERMKAIAAELAPLLSNDDWEVFASDEVRMDQEAVVRKCWPKKGQRTIVKVDRKKQSQSYIGFLNQKNYKCHVYEMP
jgi:transposase